VPAVAGVVVVAVIADAAVAVAAALVVDTSRENEPLRAPRHRSIRTARATRGAADLSVRRSKSIELARARLTRPSLASSAAAAAAAADDDVGVARRAARGEPSGVGSAHDVAMSVDDACVCASAAVAPRSARASRPRRPTRATAA